MPLISILSLEIFQEDWRSTKAMTHSVLWSLRKLSAFSFRAPKLLMARLSTYLTSTGKGCLVD